MKATANLTDDQRSLAEGYVDAINDNDVHSVEVARRGEDLTASSSSLSTNGADKTGADVDANEGGGFNIRQTATSDRTVIVMNSTAVIPDYRNATTGSLVPNINSSSGELLSHELLGHGLSNYNTGGSQFLNAIELTNLYHRVTGTGDLYRDGTSHGGTNGIPLSLQQASGVPNYLQRANSVFKIMSIINRIIR